MRAAGVTPVVSLRRSGISTRPAATRPFDFIGGLYAEEETIRKKKLDGREKLLWRRDHSRPIVEAFWRWCDDILADMTRPPKDPLLKAIAYARNHRSGLGVLETDLMLTWQSPFAVMTRQRAQLSRSRPS